MLHFKARISYALTMSAFGLLAYFWVKNEIQYARHHPPNKYLVAAGAWSYSLYLVHPQGFNLYTWLHLPNLGYIFTWVLTMLGSLLFAYAFYVLVERPSHRLARTVKLNRPAAPVPASAPGAPPSISQGGGFSEASRP
jgi:peptidoglycan/LPS O-acetylase OafA/YrhL